MSKPMVGIGLMLFACVNEIWKIFTIKELEDKISISKKAGMVSFPMETYERKDVRIERTLERLIEEELGCFSRSDINIIERPNQKFYPLPGRNVVAYYAVGIFTGNTSQQVILMNPEIAFIGWKTLDELLQESKKRPNVDLMIPHFRENLEREVLLV